MTIFWLCPRPETPSGGVLLIHKLAYLLDQAGFNSRVIQKPYFGWPKWDACRPDNADEILQGRLEQVTSADTIVVPEVMHPLAGMEEVRKIVFVQNRLWMQKSLDVYRPGTEVLVCSRYLANHVERVYHLKPIGIVRPYLDEGVWKPTPKQANHVLVIARRNDHWKKLIVALERDGFPFTVVSEPLTQRQLAEQFDKAEHYAHLVYPEGFPAICLESMRSGTIVTGTTGGGGNEFQFDHETAMVVPDPEVGRYSEDVFISGIMEKLRQLRDSPDLRSHIWQQAHEWSLKYTAEATTKELLEVFG